MRQCKHCGHKGRINRLYFTTVSKSGKTLFHYYECEVCGATYRRGFRVESLK